LNGEPVSRAERKAAALDPQNLIRIMPAEGCFHYINVLPWRRFFVKVTVTFG
jgi:hypothetical protein